jgi:single-strand DNA-binding protein
MMNKEKSERVNAVMLSGRPVRDPEVRTVQGSGNSVCSFTIAVDRRKDKNGERKADFINISAWGQTATIIGQYFTKGSFIEVSGRLSTRNYTDKEGNNRTAFEVVASEIGFGGGGGSRRNDGFEPDPEQQARRQEQGKIEADEDISLPFNLD